MSERYYVNHDLGREEVVLQGSEARHLVTVCRHRPGSRIHLFNGDGWEYAAEVVDVGRDRAELRILGREPGRCEPPTSITVACPLPRGDRCHFLIEKLTELGVACFVPLVTQRTVVVPKEGKTARLERYVIEASKQCGRNVLMRIEAPRRWEEFVTWNALPERRIVAHPGSGRLRLGPAQVAKAFAIGPEGGFTDEEIAAAQRAGWETVDLGPRTLRVETAAMYVAGIALAAGSLATDQ